MEKIRLRNAVSDETMLRMGMITGHLSKGDYHVRENGHLFRITVADKYPFDRTDLGPQDSARNLGLYYRNLNDATLTERMKMVVGGALSLMGYITAMGNNGWWDRRRVLEDSQAKCG